jgi:hypothetical protein
VLPGGVPAASAAALSGAAAAASEGAPNALRNGGYERLNDTGFPEDWRSYVFSGSPSFAADDSVAIEGSRSLRITASAYSRGTVYQDVRIPAEERGLYRFRQWIKTEEATATAYARLFLINATGGRVGNLIELKKLKGTNDWTLVEAYVMIPDDPNVVGVKVENFLENGTGIVWVDGGMLEPVDRGDDGNLVVNGGFEAYHPDLSPIQWSKWIASGTPTVSADPTVAYSGRSSLKLHAETTGRAAAVQGFPIAAGDLGKVYKLEMKVKTAGVTGGAVTRFQFNSAAGPRVGALVYLDSLSGTNDWTTIEDFVQIPNNPDIASFKIEIFLEQGTGTVWVDDVRMVPWYPLEGLRVSPEQVELMPGDTVTLDVYYAPSSASDRRLTWASSNPAIASVQGGTVTAHTYGVAVATATAADGGHQAASVIVVGELNGIAVKNYDVETRRDRTVRGVVEGTSETGSPITYWKAVNSRNGRVHVESSGMWSYYPNDGYTGQDRFVVVVEDGHGAYALSTVNVTIHPVNRAPAAAEIIQPTDRAVPVSGKLSATDPDGDILTYLAASLPEHGQLTLAEDGRWTYAPNPDYVGADQFAYTAADGLGGTDTAIVRLYAAPTADDIIGELKAANPDNRHPRLIATADDFARIRSLLTSDENVARWFAQVKREADDLLPLPPKEYSKPDGLRLDGTSARRVTTLAFAYQVTQDARYAERAWEELEYVASDAYPDWSPQHFLDTATMTQGVALAYDWLYDALSEEQRTTVRESIVAKGLKPAVPMYLDKSYWWVYNLDNWNFVCNAGMALGALAIADEEEELAGLILREAFKSIQYGLTQYSPDGSAIEGPAYWEYGTMFLVYFLNALDTTFGHDFGFSDREGLAETPQYPIYIAGPKGTFNHSDNGPALVPGRLLLWFAGKYGKPEYTWYHRFAERNNAVVGLYDLIWYNPDTYGASEPAQLDRYFERPKAVTMRSHWSDGYGSFVGFKGGVNGAPHGDLDTGSFVFDALGVRWAEDLGSEDYNVPGYWQMGENGPRWTYYRKRAEGHNTLVLNPSAEPAQAETAVSDIAAMQFQREGGGFAVADMTPAYREHAASATRAVALLDHRRQFLVQDEIEAKELSELYWFMHTRADIDIQEGGSAAILTYGDKRLWVQLLSPAEASFTVMDPAPLPTSPNPSGQAANFGVKKLTIHAENVLRSTISVWMVPLMPGEPLPTATPEVVPIAQWTVKEQGMAKLAGLSIDGETVTDFDPNRYVYELAMPSGEAEAPRVAAVAANPNHTVAVSQAAGVPGIAKITVTDPEGIFDTGTYYVSLVVPPEYGIPEDRPPYAAVSVTASAHDGNVPDNAIDGNLSTRWSASGEQWIRLDLGETRNVAAVAAAWYSGNVRSSLFNLELSEDGVHWTRVYDGTSSGETLDYEQYHFAATPARYVRINGFGNNLNAWNSIAEIGVYGPRYELERAVLTYDREEIERKDFVQLNVAAYLDSGAEIEPTELRIAYFSSDHKIAAIDESGVMYSRKTGTVDIWAEVTYRNMAIRSETLRIDVQKKNGEGPKEAEE